jgi:RNA polymerase-binding transcription factor DksA
LGSLSAVDEAAARRRLRAEQDRVRGLIQSVRAELGDEPENEQVAELAAYDQHPADMGSETFEREKDLSILEQLETELAEIQAALQRVDEGTYGIDEVTGDPIVPERLDAVPTARTNVNPDSRPESR